MHAAEDPEHAQAYLLSTIFWGCSFSNSRPNHQANACTNWKQPWKAELCVRKITVFAIRNLRFLEAEPFQPEIPPVLAGLLLALDNACPAVILTWSRRDFAQDCRHPKR